MKVTLDDTEYEIDNENEEIKAILNILTVGNNSLQILDHVRNCVASIQQLKANELKAKVEPIETESEQE
jgi:hypothetical protein